MVTDALGERGGCARLVTQAATASPKPADDEDRQAAQWLARWREGDPLAGERLFHHYFGRIHRFFARRAPRHAEDLTQRTFLACLEGRDRYHEQGRLRSYLFGVAYRVHLEFLRQRRRRARDAEQAPAPRALASRSPSSVLGARREQQQLLAALEELSDEHRSLVELYYWEELSVQELAQVFGVAPGTVKSRLARARQALRQRLEAHRQAFSPCRGGDRRISACV